MAKSRLVNAAQATRVCAAYEATVFTPVLGWVRAGRLPPELGDGYFAHDLDRCLCELHGLLALIRHDAEREWRDYGDGVLE